MVVTQVDRLSAAVDAVRHVISDFDVVCSRFREDSELIALGHNAGRATPTSGLLREALRAGLRAAELTDGDVDPTLGRALVALGYDRDFERVHRAGAGADTGADAGAGADAGTEADAGAGAGRPTLKLAAVPGWRAIRIDDEAGTVTIPAGVSLDLGATAKALAADHAAVAASSAAGGGVLVSLGGDVSTAGEAPPDGWRVRVTDDHAGGVRAPGQWIMIHSGGLATSSTVVRRWKSGEEIVHHLLDPATGSPVHGGWRTVSVAAATCLDANIASTAAIVRGRRAVGWLDSLGLPSRLVTDDGRVAHRSGWTADGDDLAALRAEELVA